jgi:hypothetical protein
LFIRDIIRLHGIPLTLVSDRGTTFRSRFWATICKQLRISQHFSSAFHPQTDGQTERVNQTLEQYLRMFINYAQDDWADFLPLAEFAYNNATSASTKHSPFYANYGFHPRFNVSSLPSSSDGVAFDADHQAQRLRDITSELQVNIGKAQESQARYYDVKHKPMSFQVGDQVWLSTRNIRTQRPSKKLDHRRLGPFTIEKLVGTQTYRLILPPTIRIHPVFHVSLLEPFVANTFPGRVATPPLPIHIDNVEEYEVETVLDSKRFGRQLKYRIHWKGYGPEDDTWEPKSNLTNSPDLINMFHATNPAKPR